MKKTLFTGAALVALTMVATQTSAQTYDNNDRTFTGPYIGVYGGYGWNDVDTSIGDTDVDGGDYGIYAGFKADTVLDKTVNQFGLGLTGAVEVYYGGSSADDNIGVATVDKDYEYGIRFLPGLAVLNDISPVGYNPYGILGYKRANFEVDGLGDETFNGFELGLGTELVAYDDLSVRVEYAHTWYGDKDIGGVNVDNSEDTLRLGVAYTY